MAEVKQKNQSETEETGAAAALLTPPEDMDFIHQCKPMQTLMQSEYRCVCVCVCVFVFYT